MNVNNNSTFTLTFTAEAQFTCTLELSQQQIKKLKKYSGKKGMLGYNSLKDRSWIKFIMNHCEFDIPVETDIENLKVEYLPPIFAQTKDKPLDNNKSIAGHHLQYKLKQIKKKKHE